VTPACDLSRPTADVDNVLEVLQYQVQRKLGRCMLRLQQYERLLKAVVAGMAVEGPIEQLPATRARQEAGASDKSLGTLVRMFTSSHLTSAPSEGVNAEAEDSSSDCQSADVAWASMRFTISMSPERYADTKAGLAELVALRNGLVHHLIERFDISDERGCRAAIAHLETCYEQIDEHCLRLKAWTMSLTASQELAPSYLQSKVFEEAFVHGINPDGSVCWPRSTIVECLREAEADCQADGWILLDAAICFISKEHRDQTPSRYGCRTWWRVLKKSGQFELRSAAGSNGTVGQTWYRVFPPVSRPDVPMSQRPGKSAV